VVDAWATTHTLSHTTTLTTLFSLKIPIINSLFFFSKISHLDSLISFCYHHLILFQVYHFFPNKNSLMMSCSFFLSISVQFLCLSLSVYVLFPSLFSSFVSLYDEFYSLYGRIRIFSWLMLKSWSFYCFLWWVSLEFCYECVCSLVFDLCGQNGFVFFVTTLFQERW
jgi:hypothetical protein